MKATKPHRHLVARRLTLLLAFSLSLLLLTGLAQGDTPAESVEENETLAAFEAELETMRQEMLIPGMSAAVVQDGQLLWSKGFGYADQERQIAATADTPYHLASVTKPIAATVLLQLVEEGTLSLDDALTDYGVNLESLGPLTVWHLLTHTSKGAPGIVHDYDGSRYSYLGQVMARATGKPFGQLLNERVITPLKMTHTAPNATWGLAGYWASLGLGRNTDHYPAVYRDLATPYQLDPAYENVVGSYSLHFSPAAGLLASVTDLAKFNIALDQDQLLDRQTKEQMFAPAISVSGKPFIYGLGWYSQEYKDTRLIWHSGGWQPSVSALMLKAPDLDLSFIILANNYNLTGPYPMDQGDVLYSTPAMAFYKYFVFPRQFGKQVPTVNWQGDPQSLLTQLEQVTDDDVRDVLERELWSYRKLYAATNRLDLAERLGDLAPQAFPKSSLRYVQPTKWLNPNRPEMTPIGITPATLLVLGWLLFAWLVLTAGTLLFLLVEFARNTTVLRRPFKVAWLLNALFFGPLALLAYWLSDYRATRPHDMSAWRRALGPAMFSVLAPISSVVLGIYLYRVIGPETPMGVPYILAMLAGAFLLNWLLFQALFRAWAKGERYWTALQRTALWTAVATILATIILLATGQLLASNWLSDIPPTSPYFLLYTLSGSLLAAALIYPIQLWLCWRGRSYWPRQSSGRPRAHAAGRPGPMPALDR